MNKTLSIIIPTFNMEGLLPRCLDSLVSARCLSELDILVVNDGSRDRSLEVAVGYHDRFPDSIRVIDKPNGNYGSTINAALPLAQGRYIRILDSDDWYDTLALEGFVQSLSSMDAFPDICVSHFSRLYRKKEETVRYIPSRSGDFDYARVYDFDSILSAGVIGKFFMHAVTYRTDMLREMGYVQTEGVSYTDEEWVYYPMFAARSIIFFDLSVYRYNMDREGQTMDASVRARNIAHIETVLRSQMSFYQSFDKSSLSPVRMNYVRDVLMDKVKLAVRYELQDFPRSSFDKQRFESLDRDLGAFFACTGLKMTRVLPYNHLIPIDLYGYWRVHGTRIPRFLEIANRWADFAVRNILSLFRS